MLRLLTRPLALLAIALGLGGAFGGCSSLDEWQRQAIFSPERDNPRWFSEPLSGTEEYDLALPNGDRVHLWHVAQPQGAATAPTVLYLHGARWNMNGSVFRIARWHELGFNVLAVDYRGFGKSTELLPSEATATEDARLAFEELKRRQPDPARRYVYGHSLGGALAIDLAARELKDDPNALAGVIIESTFTSIPDVVRGMKWGWVPGIGLAVTQPFDSMSKIQQVRAPAAGAARHRGQGGPARDGRRAVRRGRQQCEEAGEDRGRHPLGLEPHRRRGLPRCRAGVRASTGLGDHRRQRAVTPRRYRLEATRPPIRKRIGAGALRKPLRSCTKRRIARSSMNSADDFACTRRSPGWDFAIAKPCT